MAHFWLTPVISKEPLILGAARIKCLPIAELNVFRQRLDTIHSWLLPLFKANLLLGGDTDDACGIDDEELTLSLAEAEDIVFDGLPYVLSHCAENFLERLLTVEQTKQLLMQAGSGNAKLWTAAQQEWLNYITERLAVNQEVIIVREEEY